MTALRTYTNRAFVDRSFDRAFHRRFPIGRIDTDRSLLPSIALFLFYPIAYYRYLFPFAIDLLLFIFIIQPSFGRKKKLGEIISEFRTVREAMRSWKIDRSCLDGRFRWNRDLMESVSDCRVHSACNNATIAGKNVFALNPTT